MNVLRVFEYIYKRTMCLRGGTTLNQHVQLEMNRLIHRLKQDQSADGSWNYPFDTGITADAYMIILLKVLEIEDASLIEALVKRIESRQTENGSWRLFHDEKDGNLSVTIEAYYGLLYSGLRKNKILI